MVKIELDRLNDIEKKELEVYGYFKATIERFKAISGMTYVAIGESLTKPKIKQYMDYHKKQGSVIRYTPAKGTLELMSKQEVI